jgi:hypothetical protein
MLWMSRIIGAVLGFAFGLYLGESALKSHGDWTNILPFVLAVVGWLAGSELGRRLARRAVAG